MAILKHVDFEVSGFGEFASGPASVSSYAEAILALGPKAYWRLNEQAGTTLADQTGSYPLTLSGGYALGENGALATHHDDAVLFGSGSATSSGPVLPTATSAPFSFAFWVRATGVITTWRDFARQYQFNATGHVRFILSATGSLRYSDFGESIVTTNSTVSTDWRMAVLTRSAAGIVSWYVDGQLDVQGTGHGNAIHDTNFKLGVAGANRPDLILDEAAVFDYALSAEQVQSLYELGTGYFFEP